MKPTQTLANLKQKLNSNASEPRFRVRVGMATCGISAGADGVFDVFKAQLAAAGISDVELTSTGCVGRCDLEPMAEVLRSGEPPVLYIQLDEEKVKRIVSEHIVGGKIIEEFSA